MSQTSHGTAKLLCALSVDMVTVRTLLLCAHVDICVWRRMAKCYCHDADDPKKGTGEPSLLKLGNTGFRNMIQTLLPGTPTGDLSQASGGALQRGEAHKQCMSPRESGEILPLVIAAKYP